MTVSANTSLEFTRDQIIRMSYQFCGLTASGHDPSASDSSMAADFMNLELGHLQAEGTIARSSERTTLTLVADTAAYTLPTTVMDVHVGPNEQAGAIVPSSGGESVVTVISMADYLSLGNKSQSGRPRRVLIERLAAVQLTFWPVPTSAETSFRYAKIKLLADADSGDVTLDLQRRWLKAIAFLVAGQIALAKSMDLDRVRYLTSEGERLKAILQADDNQHGDIRFAISHSGRHY